MAERAELTPDKKRNCSSPNPLPMKIVEDRSLVDIQNPDDAVELQGTEILLLAIGAANLSAIVMLADTLTAVGLLDRADLDLMHRRMSSPIDAAAAVAPALLAARTQTMIDLALAGIAKRTRSPTP